MNFAMVCCCDKLFVPYVALVWCAAEELYKLCLGCYRSVLISFLVCRLLLSLIYFLQKTEGQVPHGFTFNGFNDSELKKIYTISLQIHMVFMV